MKVVTLFTGIGGLDLGASFKLHRWLKGPHHAQDVYFSFLVGASAILYILNVFDNLDTPF